MKVSVVMATYNGAKYLDQQIQSILNQSLPPAEFIVCDDRSTDQTVAILEKYAQQNKLRYVVNDYQLGLVANFKKAVSLADEANYVALSDQDDEWLSNKLEKLAALLLQIDDPKVPCMVYSDLILVNQHNEVLNPSFRNERGQHHYLHNLETLFFSNFVNGCASLINPELKHRFAEIPDDVLLNHDVWMALTALTFGKAEYLALPLVKYRKHENNVSISGNVKPKSKYRSAIKELLVSVRGKKDYLLAEFKTTRRFYNRFSNEMAADKKVLFKKFLSLQQKPYIIKKLAYRNTLKKHKF
jgi:glycosyltransferase involved in cell wall biosynthesis